MEIYLDHPHHGSAVVHSKGDASELEKRGWLLRPSTATPEKYLRSMAAKGDAKAKALLPADEVAEEAPVEAPKSKRK